LLNEFDTTETERASVISQRLAERAWPNQDPIGKRLRVGGINSQSKWTTIVGVVYSVIDERLPFGCSDLAVQEFRRPRQNLNLC